MSFQKIIAHPCLQMCWGCLMQYMQLQGRFWFTIVRMTKRGSSPCRNGRSMYEPKEETVCSPQQQRNWPGSDGLLCLARLVQC